MAKNLLDMALPQSGAETETSEDNSQDENLQELAELIYKKLREDALLENERTGRR
ncbi:MAG: hypothetical protein LWX83_14435 [Anaerolineae bacterium]|nr:hypothetical protein [Anaerolineae bacterium]